MKKNKNSKIDVSAFSSFSHEEFKSYRRNGGNSGAPELINYMVKGEVALWRAVITQALMDAGSNSNKRSARIEKAQAISWLSGASKDFAIVCSMAEYEPSYVKQKAKEAIKRGCVWKKSEKKKVAAKKSGIKKLMETKKDSRGTLIKKLKFG